MSEPKYLSTITYLVALVSNVQVTGPDLRWVELIGSYESLKDAKDSVKNHALLIADNDTQCLTIYKVNLEDNKVYDFYRKDLKTAIDAAKHAVEDKISTENESNYNEGQPHVFRNTGKPLKGNNNNNNHFPRPQKGTLDGKNIENSPVTPITVLRVPTFGSNELPHQ